MVFFILSLVYISITAGKKVPVYYLNSQLGYQVLIDASKNDKDCVHTLNPVPFPNQLSVCVRNMYLTISDPAEVYPYTIAFSFGKLLPDFSGIEEGEFLNY